MIRLQKYIAEKGITSRRKAETLILAGKVKVNGNITTELGIKIDPEKDLVEVNESGTPTTPTNTLYYVVLNKPVGYISSASNSQGHSVTDLIRPETFVKGKQKLLDPQVTSARLYPVGRLDKDSEGLILLTNDGDLTNKLTHPRYAHEKEYDLIIDKPLTPAIRRVLTKGMHLDEHTWVNGIEILKEYTAGKRTLVTVLIKEGKNRQLRKMFGRLEYKIISLKRVRMGNIRLGVLPVGKWKLVKKKDIVS